MRPPFSFFPLPRIYERCPFSYFSHILHASYFPLYFCFFRCLCPYFLFLPYPAVSCRGFPSHAGGWNPQNPFCGDEWYLFPDGCADCFASPAETEPVLLRSGVSGKKVFPADISLLFSVFQHFCIYLVFCIFPDVEIPVFGISGISLFCNRISAALFCHKKTVQANWTGLFLPYHLPVKPLSFLLFLYSLIPPSFCPAGFSGSGMAASSFLLMKCSYL